MCDASTEVLKAEISPEAEELRKRLGVAIDNLDIDECAEILYEIRVKGFHKGMIDVKDAEKLVYGDDE